MKGYLDRDEVLAARASLTARLAAAGVLDEEHPAIDAIHRPNTSGSFRPELTQGNEEVQRLLYSGRLTDFYRSFYGEDIRHYDYTWLRAIPPGKGPIPTATCPTWGAAPTGI